MSYEEKLQKVIGRLKDERDLTRRNHKTKVVFDQSSFTKIPIGELLQMDMTNCIKGSEIELRKLMINFQISKMPRMTII